MHSLSNLRHQKAGALKKKVASQHKVRTSAADRTLDSMFPVMNPIHNSSKGSGTSDQIGVSQLVKKSSQPHKVVVIEESKCFLRSVHALRDAVVKAKHNGKKLSCLAAFSSAECFQACQLY